MAFENGHEKTGGRKAGTPNKATRQIKAMLEDLLTDTGNVERLKTEFGKLKGKNLLKAWSDLLGFVAPKIQSVSVTHDIEQELENLSDDQLQELMNRIVEHWRR